MQTFLPFRNYKLAARAIDNRRLGKQLVEVQQILKALNNPSYGWQRHPVVNMWRGYRGALCAYGLACYSEWQRRFVCKQRGGKLEHKSGQFILVEWFKYRDRTPPLWAGDDRVYSGYRALLLHKNPEWYERHGWSEHPCEALDWSLFEDVLE